MSVILFSCTFPGGDDDNGDGDDNPVMEMRVA